MVITIGAVVSLIVQYLKTKFGTDSYKTLGVLFIISLIASAMYNYLVAIGYWQTVAGILITAGAFYTFVIARFES